MSEKLVTFGRGKDGTVSRCRAKDPSRCKYHSEHTQMSSKTAKTFNEAVYAANVTGYSYNDGHNRLSKQDLFKAYDEYNPSKESDPKLASANDKLIRLNAQSYLFAAKNSKNSEVE